ncbi:MAG: aldolase [Candidatus Altiarchaeota archaeon]
MAKYDIELIDLTRANELRSKFYSSGARLWDSKANLQGTCIKLVTDDKEYFTSWCENFYSMSEDVRSHGRVFSVKNKSVDGFKVYYDPTSRNAFLINCDYYGWVKSIALAVAGDILEDTHGWHSVHGSCVDVAGVGVTIIGPSGTGKTTHSWGLLLAEKTRVVSDDWYFVQLVGDEALAYGTEKNFYIRDDIAETWTKYADLVAATSLDNKKRGIADLESAIGLNRFRNVTSMGKVILLARDEKIKEITTELSSKKAVRYLKDNGYANPHLLDKCESKMNLREKFFEDYFSRVKCYLFNNILPLKESHEKLREIAFG